MINKVNVIQKELSVEYFLHLHGYTYFNMNALTYKEINQIIDGEKIYKGAG